MTATAPEAPTANPFAKPKPRRKRKYPKSVSRRMMDQLGAPPVIQNPATQVDDGWPPLLAVGDVPWWETLVTRPASAPGGRAVSVVHDASR